MLTQYDIRILDIGRRHRLFSTRHVVKLFDSPDYPLRRVPALGHPRKAGQFCIGQVL